MKFELTILGCGSAVPTLQRNAAAQVLNVLERYFLIDCGEGTQQQLRRFRVPYNKINHIFISHLHGDHFFGLIGLLSSFSLQNRRAELHIYSDKRLQEIIEFQLKVMNSRLNYPLIFHHLDREPGLIYEDRMMTVLAFPLKHRYEAPVTGFLFAEKEKGDDRCFSSARGFYAPIEEGGGFCYSRWRDYREWPFDNGTTCTPFVRLHDRHAFPGVFCRIRERG